MNSRKAIDDLRDSLRALQDHIRLFHGGRTHAYRSAAVELRKLLCDGENSLLPRLWACAARPGDRERGDGLCHTGRAAGRAAGHPGGGAGLRADLGYPPARAGTLDRKWIAALAGLAPFARESGLQRAVAPSGAAVVTREPCCSSPRSWPPADVPLRIFLRAVGRPGQTEEAGLAAVARKLLVAINAMIRNRRPREPAVVLEPSCCWVIHYDVVRDSEVYVRRAGRAGSSVTMVARH